MTRQFAGFLAVGGIAAVINIVVRVMVSPVMPFELSIVVAFVAGLVTAFLLNRAFVFKTAAEGKAGQQGLRFTLVNLLSLAQIWIVGVGLARIVFPWIHWVWHAQTIAHSIAVASPVVTSYFAHKYYSFAPAG